jgi:DNA-binding Lrp family transcriptional regulator
VDHLLEKNTMKGLDSMDVKILTLLQENSHYTIKQLSAKLYLSATPIYERIRRLEKEGIIKKYVALLDKEKLGKALMVFCSVSLKEHAKQMGERFVTEILLFPEVVEFYNISGEYDFLLKVIVKDMQEYQNFIMNKLASLENIGNTHSNFVMSEIKSSTVIPI